MNCVLMSNMIFFALAIGGVKKCFEKPSIDDLNLKHLNAIINHDGLGVRTPFNQTRSAHILLDYPIPYYSFSSRTNIVKWVGDLLSDEEKYDLFKKFHIVNGWASQKDNMIRDLIVQGKSQSLAFADNTSKKKKQKKGSRKNKGKELVGDLGSAVELSLPINSNRPLRISEPSERVDTGVKTTQVPVAIPLFRGRGETVPVLNEETDRPSTVDLAVEELFEEADCPPLRRRSRRRSPLPPSSPQFSETEDMAGRRSVLDLMNFKIYKAGASIAAGAFGISASPPLKMRRLVQIGSSFEGTDTPSVAESDQGGVVEVPHPLVNVEAQESLGVEDLIDSPT
ncbi:hypothetical protein LguiB_018058 [Lonicera macranthoides]